MRFPFEREFARSSATLRNFENPRSNVPGDYIPCSSSGKTLAEQGICEIQKFTLASPVNPRTSQIPGNVSRNKITENNEKYSFNNVDNYDIHWM